MYSLSGLGPEAKGDLVAMREAMGVMQHHDAITGTEKQHVADDYARILTDAFEQCGIVVEEAFKSVIFFENIKLSTVFNHLHIDISIKN